MRTFLGVPILLRGVAYGNLYLTEKDGAEDFTEEDEELTQLLAAQAAVAIENARLYESLDAVAAPARVAERDRQRARRRELELEPLLGLIARRLRELVDAKAGADHAPGRRRAPHRRRRGRGELRQSSGWSSRFRGSKAGRVLERGRSERVDSISKIRRSTRGGATARHATRRSTSHWSHAAAAIGVIDRPRPAWRRRPVHRRRPATRREARGAGGGRGRPLRARQPRCASGASSPAQELERTPARTRAPRRDRPGAHVDPARAEAVEQARRRAAARAVASVRELVVSTLQDVRRPRRRAAPVGARRLRPRGRGRAARRDDPRADRNAGRRRGAARARSVCPRRSRRRSTGSCRRP